MTVLPAPLTPLARSGCLALLLLTACLSPWGAVAQTTGSFTAGVLYDPGLPSDGLQGLLSLVGRAMEDAAAAQGPGVSALVRPSPLSAWDPYNLGRAIQSLQVTSSITLTSCAACAGVQDAVLALGQGVGHVLHACVPLAGDPQRVLLCEQHEVMEAAMAALISHAQFDDWVLIRQGDEWSATTLTSSSISKVAVDAPQKNGTQRSATTISEFDLLADQLFMDFSNFYIEADRRFTMDLLAKFRDTKGGYIGPDFNWLLDFRHDMNAENEQELREILKNGDNVAIVTKSKAFAESLAQDLQDVVMDFVASGLLGLWPVLDVEFPASVLEVKKCVRSCAVGEPLKNVGQVTAEGVVKENINAMIFDPEFKGFSGRLFKVGIKPYDPFVTIKYDANGTMYYDGFMIDLLKSTAITLDFTFVLSEPKDAKFGIMNEDGTWNGLLGEVIRGEIDFTAVGQTLTAEREAVVDFAVAVSEEPATVVFRKPQQETKLLSILRPFHWTTWVTIGASVVLATLVFYGGTWACCRILGIHDPMLEWMESFIYIIGTLMHEGGPKNLLPRTPVGQIIAGAWWLVAIILYAVYTSNLTAFLAVDVTRKPFDTLAELAAQDEYKIGVEDGIIQMSLFREATRGVYHELWKGISRDPNNLVADVWEGIQKTRNEKFAFVAEKTPLEAIVGADCELDLIKEDFFAGDVGFVFPEGWPYTKYFNKVMTRAVEGGIVTHYRQRHMPTANCDTSATSLKAKPATLADVSGNFLIAGLIIVIGAIVLMLELCCGRGRHKADPPPDGGAAGGKAGGGATTLTELSAVNLG